MVTIERISGMSLLNEDILSRLVEIHTSNNEQFFPTLEERYHTDLHGLPKELESMFLERINEGHIFYVAYIEDTIVGFNIHTIEEVEINTIDFKCMSIGTTSISRNFTNRGIGKVMYAQMDKDASSLYDVDIAIRKTWSTNERQKHLYELMGFELLLVEEDFYGKDAVNRHTYMKKYRAVL